MVEESSQLAVHVTENENQTAPTRKIAPAPTDDDENESSSTSIRGGRWTSDEHERFLAGFKIHGHKWKRVQQVVRTRSVTQVRTHAQKYLLKLAKMKAETKQKSSEGDGASSDKQTIKSESGEGFHTSDEPAPEPEEDAMSPNGRVSRKKFKSHHHGDLDEEYIAAAAKTLCLLMRQNIDSILDGKEVAENDKDYEPYEYHRGYANEHHYYEDVAFVEGKKIYSA
jgi:SHAQKYF class myb-like DNA-binding protein